MSIRQSSSKHSFQNSDEIVHQALHQLFSGIMKPCKYLGLSIFSLDSRGEFHFRICSLEFIVVILRFVSVIIAAVYFVLAQEKFNMVFPEQSKTEEITQKIRAVNMYFGEILLTILTFCSRNKIIQFHKNLTQFLTESVNMLTKVEKKEVVRIVPHALKILKRFKRIIFVAFYYSAGFGVVKAFYRVVTAGKPLNWWSHSLVGLPIFNTFWAANSTLRLLSRLLMTTLFHTLRTSSLIMNIHLGKLGVSKFSLYNANEEILATLRKQELVIAQANAAFGWCFTIDILLMAVSIIASLFSVIYFLVHEEFVGALSFGVPLILHSAIVFELCNAAHGFEAEVRHFEVRIIRCS